MIKGIVKQLFIMLCLVISVLSATPVLGKTNESINLSDIDKGIVHISYKSTTNKKLKVIIQKGDKKYTYNLDASGKQETFPLQLGNGEYKINVMENTVESKYRLIESKTLTLNMIDSNLVYLNSIQNIPWEEGMKAIEHANELAKTNTKANEKVDAFYTDIVKQYSYDYNKLATLPATYLPVIDNIYKEKSGICYDFSALYASMLRSQGIPVKLVKGYTPNAVGYHAWNEAYNTATGEWMIIDSTYDLQVIKKKIPVKMIKSSKDYEKINEY